MIPPGFIDYSAVLGPGIYALLWKGEVMYIGQSTVLVSRLAGYVESRRRHRRVKLGAKTIRGVVFNEIWIRPTPLAELNEMECYFIRKYTPKYNIQLKVPLNLEDLCKALVPVDGPPVEAPIRRRV